MGPTMAGRGANPLPGRDHGDQPGQPGLPAPPVPPAPGPEGTDGPAPVLRVSPEDRPGSAPIPSRARVPDAEPPATTRAEDDPCAPTPPTVTRGRLLSWLRRDLARAHRLLRRGTTTGGRGSPYRLPWILMMGPPRAGKTQALARAGLIYPDESLRGGRQDDAGRTLGACLWLGDRAVMIDTAGALVADPAADGDADGESARGARLWRALVQKIRDDRPVQPLNAVILALPLPWLTSSTRDRREAAARVLRQRLETTYRITGRRLPIHVWLTQVDRLVGFHATFEALGGQERDQVWGFSLPLVAPGAEETALAVVPARLDGLVQRLNARLLERLHQDPGMRQGAAIWAFPAQVASLRGPLAHMMDALFRSAAWQESLLPRGVHLVSGGVGGAVVDRLGSVLARRFALEDPSEAAPAAVADLAAYRVHDPDRGWFLRRALGTVILGEAGLVAGPPGRRRARVWRNRLAWVAGLVVLGVGVAMWGKSLLGNHALLTRAEVVADTLRGQVQGLAISGIDDTDFAAILPPLDTLRGMPLGPVQGGEPASWMLTLGLYQGHAVHDATETAYADALRRLLGPRLLLALERQLTAPGDPLDDERRLAMAAYLMLGDRRALDGEVVWRWLETLAARALPGAAAEAEDARRSLLRHAAALLALGPPPMALTPALEEYARLALGPGGRW